MNVESLAVRLRRSYERNLQELQSFLNGLYPDFVVDPHVETIRGEVPVFTFHFLEPKSFQQQLEFLAANDYSTLTADQFWETMVGHVPVPERAVLLTFDDGWESLWTCGYPLLKRYGMRGVCFIIPGLIRRDERDYPDPEHFWAGKVIDGQALATERTGQRLCTWREIEEMAGAGTIEFQSHTMYHSLIFTSPRLVDFLAPAFDPYAANLNLPVVRCAGVDNVDRKLQWGTPIYAHAPRMAGRARYYDDEVLRERCIHFVREHGGERFFRDHGWRRKLRELVAAYKAKAGERGCLESATEMREAIYCELVESKRLIESKLGQCVRHLCYPYFTGSPLSIELSRAAGYECNYWGVLENRRGNRPGDDPYRIVRLRGEFLFRLPGSGRKSLWSICGRRLVADARRFFRNVTRPDHRSYTG